MQRLQLFTPTAWAREFPSPGINFLRKFLIQGDSWFSIGALPPSVLTTNMPHHMAFNFSACGVNFAQPGAELGQIVNVEPTSKWVFNPAFEAALRGRLAEKWDAVLLSAGGNDLIRALNTPPFDVNGQRVPQEKRLLRLPDEWGPQADPSRFVSEAGWKAFELYLDGVFQVLVDWRDATDSKSPLVPIVVHSYSHLQPRFAGTGGFPGKWIAGPWLSGALNTYSIPDVNDRWHTLASHLIDRLFTLLTAISTRYPLVFVADLRLALAPAAASDTGADGDWANEIHPTSHGYETLARSFCAKVEEALTGALQPQSQPIALPARRRPFAAPARRRLPRSVSPPTTRRSPGRGINGTAAGARRA